MRIRCEGSSAKWMNLDDPGLNYNDKKNNSHIIN